MKLCLSKIPYNALTTDLWKNQKLEYFLTLTGHFYTVKYKYYSIIMSFRKFKKSHKSVNISNFIIKELNKLNIIDRVVAVTTDNEAAVVSACRQIGDDIHRISCMCHNLNLIVKNGLQLWKKPKK